MLVSILHRVSGDGLAVAGSLLFLWWLGAIAGGEASYRAFVDCVWGPSGGEALSLTNWLGRALLVALTWAFYQHLFSGLRHLVLDVGAGYELRANRRWALAVMLAALFATAATWLAILTRMIA